MTRDDIVKWASEAAIMPPNWGATENQWKSLHAFAALAAAAERAACAKVCDEVSLQAVTSWKLAYQPKDQGREMGADDCAAAIRARGQM